MCRVLRGKQRMMSEIVARTLWSAYILKCKLVIHALNTLYYPPSEISYRTKNANLKHFSMYGRQCFAKGLPSVEALHHAVRHEETS